MMRETWEALLWKEWHETRRAWALYAVIFNIPAMAALLYLLTAGPGLLVDKTFGTITAQETFGFILTAKLFYALFVGFVLISFITTSQFSREWDNGSFFYLMDQPAPRWALLLAKFAVGGTPVWVCASSSVPLAATSVYFGYWIIGSEQLETALRPVYFNALAHSWKGVLWELIFATMAVTNGLLFSVLVRRRWLGAALGMIGFLTVYMLMVKFLLPPVSQTTPAVGDGRSLAGYNPLQPVMIVTTLVVSGAQFWAAVRALGRRQRK